MTASAGRTHILDTGRLHPLEIGAWIWAIMAFPELNTDKDLSNVVEGIVAFAFHESIKIAPGDAVALGEDYGRFVTISNREAKRRTRTLLRRMRDRMAAARMSRGFFREGLTNESTPLPPSMKRLSLNQLSCLVQAEVHQSNAENVEHRVWRPSRPVIHIAMALQLVTDLDAPGQNRYPYELSNQELNRQVVELSEFHEPFVEADKRFGIRPERLVRIRLR